MVGIGMWADSVIALGIDPDGFPRPLAVDSAGMLLSSGGAGVSDHGALTGLTDDDHPQYVLATGTRNITGIQTFDSGLDSYGEVNLYNGPINLAGDISVQGTMYWDSDATIDLGFNSRRPRDIFTSRKLTIGPEPTVANPMLRIISAAKAWSLVADSDLDRLVLEETVAKLTAWGSTIPAMLLGSTVGLGWTSGAVDATSADVFLYRDAANVLAQRNGTTAQVFKLYKTWANTGTDNERLDIGWNGVDAIIINSTAGGTGTARTLAVGTGGAADVVLFTGGVAKWVVNGSGGHLLAGTDNAYDIGASGATRPRDVHNSRNHLIDAAAVGTSGVGVLGIGNGTEPSTSPADMVQVYSVDIAAGRATLGLRTEEAIAVDASLLSTNSIVVRINGANYKIGLTAV